MRALLAVWHLLLASLHNWTRLTGTTTVGVFTLSNAAVGLSAVLLVKRWIGGMAQTWQQLRATILEAAAGTIAVPIFMWGLLIVVMIPWTIYKDHQHLLARIRTLNSERLRAANDSPCLNPIPFEERKVEPKYQFAYAREISVQRGEAKFP